MWGRARFKRWLSRFCAIDGYCKDCGARMVPVWTTDDATYAALVRDGRELCLLCFDKLARTYYGRAVVGELIWTPGRAGGKTGVWRRWIAGQSQDTDGDGASGSDSDAEGEA